MKLAYLTIKTMLKDNHVPYSNPLDAVVKVMRKLDKNYMIGAYTQEEYDELVDVLAGMMHEKWWL